MNLSKETRLLKTIDPGNLHPSNIFPWKRLPVWPRRSKLPESKLASPYETLAEGLRAERLNTLREKYLDYAARHEAE